MDTNIEKLLTQVLLEDRDEIEDDVLVNGLCDVIDVLREENDELRARLAELEGQSKE